MKKTNASYFLTIIGVGLFAVGLYFIKTIEDPQGILRALPYICVGFGCAIIGHGMGEIIERQMMKSNPVAAKRLEINKKDERNLAISYRAKAKTYDMMVFALGALMLAFALMGIDFLVILLLVFAYLFSFGYTAFYRVKYFKEM